MIAHSSGAKAPQECALDIYRNNSTQKGRLKWI